MAVELEGPRQRLGQAARQRDDVLGLLNFLGHDRELVAAETAHRVDVADGVAQAPRDLDQQEIAHGMTERVVDLLEPVEVDAQHRDAGPSALGAHERALQAIVEQEPVRQIGQRVVMRDVVHPLFRRRALLHAPPADEGRDEEGEPRHRRRTGRDQAHPLAQQPRQPALVDRDAHEAGDPAFGFDGGGDGEQHAVAVDGVGALDVDAAREDGGEQFLIDRGFLTPRTQAAVAADALFDEHAPVGAHHRDFGEPVAPRGLDQREGRGREVVLRLGRGDDGRGLATPAGAEGGRVIGEQLIADEPGHGVGRPDHEQAEHGQRADQKPVPLLRNAHIRPRGTCTPRENDSAGLSRDERLW